MILTAGLTAILLWALRARDPLLLSLGIFTSLYAFRLFISSELVEMATGVPGGQLERGAMIITYCIPIPLVIFLRELLGTGWKNSVVIWLRVQIGFAAVAIAADLFGYRSMASMANRFLIIAGSIVLLFQLFFFQEAEVGGWLIRTGFVGFFACVLMNNMGVVPAGVTLEAIGFLGLVVSLGCVAALRTLGREKKLLAVEQELSTARRIQASTLPKSVPDMPGLEIATRYVPMTAVAGDFYDFLLIDERRMTILIADVSGHGVPAALVASMLKVGFAAQRHNQRDPAAILTGLNGMLIGVLDGQFVTAACAYIDLEGETFTYSAAGHPPALLLKSTGEIVEILENGLLLGPFHNARYANRSVAFHGGDILLLYTDGIVEATLSGGLPFGDEGLKEVITKHRAAQVSGLADAVIQAASGPAQEDDLTLIVVQAVR
jgi:sigma-B regulation protein RsbU (phosphoserine phosphatase)